MRQANDKDLEKVIPHRIKEQTFNLSVNVQKDQGQPLVVPSNNLIRAGYFDTIIVNQKKDDPLLDSNKVPLVGSGFVYYHQQAWNGVATDGTQTMVFSNIYPDMINALSEKLIPLRAIGCTQEDELNCILETVAYSKISITDTLSNNITSSITHGLPDLGVNITPQLTSDTSPVWFIPGPCMFKTENENSEYIPAEGAFLVKSEKSPYRARVHTKDSLLEKFVDTDGGTINLDNIPKVEHDHLIPTLINAALVTEVLRCDDPNKKMTGSELRQIVMQLNYPGRNDSTGLKEPVGLGLKEACTFLYGSSLNI